MDKFRFSDMMSTPTSPVKAEMEDIRSGVYKLYELTLDSYQLFRDMLITKTAIGGYNSIMRTNRLTIQSLGYTLERSILKLLSRHSVFAYRLRLITGYLRIINEFDRLSDFHSEMVSLIFSIEDHIFTAQLAEVIFDRLWIQKTYLDKFIQLHNRIKPPDNLDMNFQELADDLSNEFGEFNEGLDILQVILHDKNTDALSRISNILFLLKHGTVVCLKIIEHIINSLTTNRVYIF